MILTLKDPMYSVLNDRYKNDSEKVGTLNSDPVNMITEKVL